MQLGALDARSRAAADVRHCQQARTHTGHICPRPIHICSGLRNVLVCLSCFRSGVRARLEHVEVQPVSVRRTLRRRAVPFHCCETAPPTLHDMSGRLIVELRGLRAALGRQFAFASKGVAIGSAHRMNKQTVGLSENARTLRLRAGSSTSTAQSGTCSKSRSDARLSVRPPPPPHLHPPPKPHLRPPSPPTLTTPHPHPPLSSAGHVSLRVSLSMHAVSECIHKCFVGRTRVRSAHRMLSIACVLRP